MIDVRIDTSKSEKKDWLIDNVGFMDYELLAEKNSGLQVVTSDWSFCWVDIVRFKNANDAFVFKLRFGV